MLRDSTLELLALGYDYGGRQFERRGASGGAQTRLLFARTTVLRGPEAVALFYDESLVARAGAMPSRVRRTLLGVGGIQGLDDTAHHARRGLFLRLLDGAAVEDVRERVETLWRDELPRWERAGPITLHDEIGLLLCRAAHDWVGVPYTQGQLAGRYASLAAMIDAPAALGPRHLRGRAARRGAERGLARLVSDVRAGVRDAPPGSPLEAISAFCDESGSRLAPRVAAVELLNLLRPIVAVQRFVVFAALALETHPEWRAKVRADPSRAADVASEVRRYYPFFPMVAGKARRAIMFDDLRVPAGSRLLLDLETTDHEPADWSRPWVFDPDRFAHEPSLRNRLVAQGGGPPGGHRCPGEALTQELTALAIRRLCAMSYTVPAQDLRVDRRRMPTGPRSGMVLDVTRTGGE